MNAPENVWHGWINPGWPVKCEVCGTEYVPVTYEGTRNPCPRCGK